LPTFAAAVTGGLSPFAVGSGDAGYYNILAPEPGSANPTITVFALKPCVLR
jgi:hypothetical protein